MIGRWRRRGGREIKEEERTSDEELERVRGKSTT